MNGEIARPSHTIAQLATGIANTILSLVFVIIAFKKIPMKESFTPHILICLVWLAASIAAVVWSKKNRAIMGKIGMIGHIAGIVSATVFTLQTVLIVYVA